MGAGQNRKRTQRLWREEELRVPTRKRKRRRLGESTSTVDHRLRAERPNHVWALDFQADQTADGRQLRLLNVVDEFTREALAMECERSIGADQTVAVLERIVAHRGGAEHIRCDNGPELTAHALRDWCRASGTATIYIEPEATWQNPYVESFNARVRDEVLDIELFDTLAEARLIVDDWRAGYNAGHPHSALGMMPPPGPSGVPPAPRSTRPPGSLREEPGADATMQPDIHPSLSFGVDRWMGSGQLLRRDREFSFARGPVFGGQIRWTAGWGPVTVIAYPRASEDHSAGTTLMLNDAQRRGLHCLPAQQQSRAVMSPILNRKGV